MPTGADFWSGLAGTTNRDNQYYAAHNPAPFNPGPAMQQAEIARGMALYQAEEERRKQAMAYNPPKPF